MNVLNDEINSIISRHSTSAAFFPYLRSILEPKQYEFVDETLDSVVLGMFILEAFEMFQFLNDENNIDQAITLLLRNISKL